MTIDENHSQVKGRSGDRGREALTWFFSWLASVVDISLACKTTN